MAQPRRDNITQLRLRAGIKRPQLAERIGCSYSHLYNVETGHKSPSIEFLYRLAAALDTDIDQVMVRTDKGAA